MTNNQSNELREEIKYRAKQRQIINPQKEVSDE